MYQFTTTNVINSAYALDYNGNILVDGTNTQIPKYAGTATAFNVAKVGTFKAGNIVSVYKRPYTAGVLEIAKLTVSAQTAGDLLRLTILIKQSQATPSEYVNYTLDFQKPVVVEVVSLGNAANDAAALVAQLNSLKDRFGYNYVTASVNSAEITITAKEHTQRFKEFILSEAVANANSLTQYDQVTLVTGAVTTPGALGFGDDAWMQRAVMLPTLENTRYFGISKDERPIMGGQYTEYALRYSIAKDGNDGTWGAGTSVTTHIFYVISTQQAAFEAEVQKAFAGVVTIGGDQDVVIVGDQNISSTTTGYTASNFTAGETVNLTSSATGVATVLASVVASAYGVATFTVTKVAAGTTTITATGATSTKSATLVVVVT